MKNIYLNLCCVSLVLSSFFWMFSTGDIACETITVNNSGFEEWENGGPKIWAATGGVVTISKAPSRDVVEGNMALRIETDIERAGAVQSGIPVEPDQMYTMLVWARAEKGQGAIQISGQLMVDNDAIRVSDEMKLVLLHFKTFAHSQKADILFYASKVPTVIYVDEIRIIPGRVEPESLTAREQRKLAPRWTFHPPEYYQQLRQEVRDIMTRTRAEFNAADIAKYKTEITENNKTIELKRHLYSISFSKASACITDAVVRGEDLKDAVMPNLVVVAQNGDEYSQIKSTDGTLTLRDEKFNVHLEGEFTPRAGDGRKLGVRFGVRYNFYKMAGMLTVDYFIKEIKEESAFGGVQKIASVPQIKRITVYSTLGKTKSPFNYFYRHYGQGIDGKYHQAKCYELGSEKDDILLPEKHSYCLWTNGAAGFGVYARGSTYKQMQIESNDLEPIYFAYELKDKERLISATFMHSKEGKPLSKDFKADLALAVYPIRKFEPTSKIIGGLQYYFMAEVFENPADAADLISEFAQRGVTSTLNAGCRNESIFPSDEVKGPNKIERYREAIMTWNRLQRENGLQPCASQIGHIQWTDELLEAEGVFTQEEMKSIRKDRSRGNPLIRELMLTMLYNYWTKLGFDGIHFDLIGDEIVRSVIYQQEVRLLCDSLPGDKFFFYHNHMEVSPPMALADYSVPGEQWMVGRWDHFPKAYLEIPYNPLITGTHHRLYNDRSYDLRSPRIWKQILRNMLAPDMALYTPEIMRKTTGWRRAGHNDGQEFENLKKYGLPNAIFDIGTTTLHHHYDEDYSKYAIVSNPEVTVNIFSRPGECMLTISNGLRDSDEVMISLNKEALELGAEGLIVYDTVEQTVVPFEIADGWVKLEKQVITDAPLVFVVKAVQPEQPRILWHDWRVRNWREAEPLHLWAGTKRVDFECDSLPGRSITAIYCGELGRPQMLLGNVDHFALDGYDYENNIMYVMTDFPLNNKITTARVWFTFEWDDTEWKAKETIWKSPWADK